MGDIQVKDATISELTTKLREMARKHGDHTAIANPANIKGRHVLIQTTSP